MVKGIYKKYNNEKYVVSSYKCGTCKGVGNLGRKDTCKYCGSSNIVYIPDEEYPDREDARCANCRTWLNKSGDIVNKIIPCSNSSCEYGYINNWGNRKGTFHSEVALDISVYGTSTTAVRKSDGFWYEFVRKLSNSKSNVNGIWKNTEDRKSTRLNSSHL